MRPIQPGSPAVRRASLRQAAAILLADQVRQATAIFLADQVCPAAGDTGVPAEVASALDELLAERFIPPAGHDRGDSLTEADALDAVFAALKQAVGRGDPAPRPA